MEESGLQKIFALPILPSREVAQSVIEDLLNNKFEGFWEHPKSIILIYPSVKAGKTVRVVLAPATRE